MGVAREYCNISKSQGSKTVYKVIAYDHDTTDGSDTYAFHNGGAWQDAAPSYAGAQCPRELDIPNSERS